MATTKKKTTPAKKAVKSAASSAKTMDRKYGKLGSLKRTKYEIKTKSYAIGEVVKKERLKASMSQEQLAEKTGTKQSFISRIENGYSDVRLSTLYKIFEHGLGKKISLRIQ